MLEMNHKVNGDWGPMAQTNVIDDCMLTDIYFMYVVHSRDPRVKSTIMISVIILKTGPK